MNTENISGVILLTWILLVKSSWVLYSRSMVLLLVSYMLRKADLFMLSNAASKLTNIMTSETNIMTSEEVFRSAYDLV